MSDFEPVLPKTGTGMLRWLWLAIAIWGVLLTPGAILSAINLYRSDHRLGLIVPMAFGIRLAQIGLFTWLWWKAKPKKSTQGAGVAESDRSPGSTGLA